MSNMSLTRAYVMDLIDSLPDETLLEIIKTCMVTALENSWNINDAMELTFLHKLEARMEQAIQQGELGEEMDRYIESMKKSLFEASTDIIQEIFADAIDSKLRRS